MAERQGGPVFHFERVQIFQDEDNTLGAGSYGAVYKAKCDQLLCAAKILHPILFQTHDPAASRILERFQQECEFVSGIRHPNIVQFLGGTRDPQSGRPVLLMELVDESLTKLLARIPQSLPYHVEVCLSHDIVLALAYLHSNQIIHRDLSSNNVLVLAGRKAKITDFGMSRIVGDSRDLTQVPGTEVYMPPECFTDRPAYDSKMDVFSLGVLILQIMTRQFPSPTARFITCSPGHARIVPERERRRDHINLIDSAHLLRNISLLCLESSDCRPSARELCNEMDTLKSQERYVQSSEAEGVDTGGNMAALQRELAEKTEEVRRKDEQLRERETEMTGLRQQLAELERELREKDSCIRQLEGGSSEGPLSLSWENRGRAPTALASGSSVVRGEIAYLRPAGKTQVYSYNHVTREWSELVQCRYQDSTLALVGDALTTVGGRERHTNTGTLLTYTSRRSHEWEEKWPQMSHPRSNPAVISERSVVVAAGGMSGQSPVAVVEVLHTQLQQWQECADLPLSLALPSACVANERVFLTGENDSVFSICLSDLTRARQSRAWTTHASLPRASASCTVIKGQLIAIGGQNPGLRAIPTNDVYKYDANSDKWERTDSLSLARSHCFVLHHGSEVLVVGGHVQRKANTDTIEAVTLC